MCNADATFLSNNYGLTWNNLGIADQWNCGDCGVSYSGKYMYRPPNQSTGNAYGYYFSNDYGNTWINPYPSVNTYQTEMACDATGRTVLFSSYNHIFGISTDYGKTYSSLPVLIIMFQDLYAFHQMELLF